MVNDLESPPSHEWAKEVSNFVLCRVKGLTSKARACQATKASRKLYAKQRMKCYILHLSTLRHDVVPHRAKTHLHRCPNIHSVLSCTTRDLPLFPQTEAQMAEAFQLPPPWMHWNHWGDSGSSVDDEDAHTARSAKPRCDCRDSLWGALPTGISDHLPAISLILPGWNSGRPEVCTSRFKMHVKLHVMIWRCQICLNLCNFELGPGSRVWKFRGSDPPLHLKGFQVEEAQIPKNLPSGV